MARDALKVAERALSDGFPADAVSRAYYAMLSAARAALSERDLYAKTHSGTWSLFSNEFVRTGAVGREWPGRAGKAQELREGGDYEAVRPDPEAAAEIVKWAQEFVDLIDGLFDRSQ